MRGQLAVCHGENADTAFPFTDAHSTERIQAVQQGLVGNTPENHAKTIPWEKLVGSCLYSRARFLSGVSWESVGAVSAYRGWGALHSRSTAGFGDREAATSVTKPDFFIILSCCKSSVGQPTPAGCWRKRQCQLLAAKCVEQNRQLLVSFAPPQKNLWC